MQWGHTNEEGRHEPSYSQDEIRRFGCPNPRCGRRVVRRTSFADKHCPIARSLEVVGDWWTLLIVREALFKQAATFEDFRKRLGIASNILTTRLEHLVGHGIMERVVGPGTSRVRYQLTDKGRALWPVLAALVEWGNEWVGEGPMARVVHSCGQRLPGPKAECPACGGAISAEELRVQPLIPQNARPGR